jgi:hypothetical protein
MVLDEGGACLPDSTVGVILGQTVLQSAEQEKEQSNCDFWDAYGGGVIFNDLPMTDLTIRATATGHKPREVISRPNLSSFPLLITLQNIQ